MIKKLISFTKAQIEWLIERKARTGNSIASMVRTAVDEYIKRTDER